MQYGDRDDVARALDRERVRLERATDELAYGRSALDLLRTVRAIETNHQRRAELVPMYETAALRGDQAELLVLQQQIQALIEENASLKRQLHEVRESSNRCALTGVLTRRAFDEVLEREWNRSRRSETPLGMLFVDVDHFKTVNDEFGHLAGDAALRAIAQAIDVQARRSGEIVARYGGDEFVVILPGTGLEGVLAVGERIRASVEELRLQVDEQVVALTVSLGGAAQTAEFRTPAKALTELADRAVYAAKNAGRAVCIGCAIEDGQPVYYRPAAVSAEGEGASVTDIAKVRRR